MISRTGSGRHFMIDTCSCCFSYLCVLFADVIVLDHQAMSLTASRSAYSCTLFEKGYDRRRKQLTVNICPLYAHFFLYRSLILPQESTHYISNEKETLLAFLYLLPQNCPLFSHQICFNKQGTSYRDFDNSSPPCQNVDYTDHL